MRPARRKKAITTMCAGSAQPPITTTIMATAMIINTTIILMITITAMHKMATAPTNAGAVPRYLRDPAAIYRRSFALIRREVNLARFPRELRPLALRLVHTSGEPAILNDLVWSKGAATTGRKALASGSEILVDAMMVAAGITARRARCTLNSKRVPALAKRLETTRSA